MNQQTAELMSQPGEFTVSYGGGYVARMSYAAACTFYELMRRAGERAGNPYSLVGRREVIRSQQPWRRSPFTRARSIRLFVPA